MLVAGTYQTLSNLFWRLSISMNQPVKERNNIQKLTSIALAIIYYIKIHIKIPADTFKRYLIRHGLRLNEQMKTNLKTN